MFYLGRKIPPSYLYSLYLKGLKQVAKNWPKLFLTPKILLRYIKKIIRIFEETIYLAGFYIPTLNHRYQKEIFIILT